ncbi:hypothetical protein, partial [Klebsiella pneumoniae]|uniref:hypothetical protein n=1 Tax=Klebsiella pneumoniae TaxID=573 RepID=UPI001B3BE124
MNNKKVLAKTFWNIWEWWWVGLGGILGYRRGEFIWGKMGCAGDVVESEVRTSCDKFEWGLGLP